MLNGWPLNGNREFSRGGGPGTETGFPKSRDGEGDGFI